MRLQGRSRQCGTVDGLLADVRAGRSRTLVVRGEPGIGKTALLGYAADSAPAFGAARACGVESEMELPFAALHQLCGAMLDRLDRLPGPQREALAVAFGLASGGAPDRFLVGLGALSLLSDVAMDKPLLCLIDDAQWLDQASGQALAFVARRVDAEPIALMFGTRDPGFGDDLAGLPDLVLGPLPRADAQAVLASAIPGRLDGRVRDRIVAESGGNPLALLELPRAVTAAELAGGFGVAGAAPLAGRIEQSFLRRVASLPEMTQRLLLLAAADPTGDPILLGRAAGRLGISSDAGPAEAAGLLTVGAHVGFRHPLVRSAVYGAASAEERRAAHRALAEATDPVADPDRRAWHRAQATSGPDEAVAGELQHSADRARARGGLAAAAAFLERSVALTADPPWRAERALAAAQAECQAGAFDAGLALVAIAEAGPLDEFQRGQAFLLRGEIALASRHGSDAPPLLLSAARRLDPLDVRLARGAYLEALSAALMAGRLAGGGGLREVAEAALAARPSARSARPPDLLLDGLALVITEGYRAGAPLLQRAVHAVCRGREAFGDEELRSLWPAYYAAGLLWDYQSWDVLSAGQVRLAREAGALIALPTALNSRAGVYLFAGEFAAVASLAAEVESVTEVTGSMVVPYAALALAAFRGRGTEAASVAEASAEDAERRGEGGGLTFVQWATAVLCNGLGRYEQALAAAQQASQDSPAQRFSNWAVAELIEAATRTGAPERAASALLRLSDAARASGTNWALGIEARCRALATSGPPAEALYRESIDRFRGTRLRVDLGRAHLLYGEWLRRRKRRTDAREQLGAAHQILAAIGADGFADRAARELRASGERVPTRSTGPAARLTAQETQVARLAAEGLSNPEIAARLFISPRTAEYHLGKVFAKLNIGSRNQLHGLLADGRSERRRPSR